MAAAALSDRPALVVECQVGKCHTVAYISSVLYSSQHMCVGVSRCVCQCVCVCVCVGAPDPTDALCSSPTFHSHFVCSVQVLILYMERIEPTEFGIVLAKKNNKKHEDKIRWVLLQLLFTLMRICLITFDLFWWNIPARLERQFLISRHIPPDIGYIIDRVWLKFDPEFSRYGVGFARTISQFFGQLSVAVSSRFDEGSWSFAVYLTLFSTLLRLV